MGAESTVNCGRSVVAEFLMWAGLSFVKPFVFHFFLCVCIPGNEFSRSYINYHSCAFHSIRHFQEILVIISSLTEEKLETKLTQLTYFTVLFRKLLIRSSKKAINSHKV
jgi:hypothetical protein